MNKFYVFLVVSLVCTSFVFSQRQADNWFFGNNAGLNFGSGNPTVITGSALSTVEGCSSFSDENGNLLFYTDGITVYNRNHQVMPNGNGLGGNPSSTQSGLIIPKPGDPNIFYLFTVGTNAVGNTGLAPNAGFKYYTIDITADSGLGDVVSGPVNLSGGLSSQWSEKVTAVEADGCNGYWAISFVNNKFYSYFIDNTGVSNTPVISTVSNTVSDVRGYLKVSPDGTKIVSANMISGTLLYDFDVATGQVSNGNALNLSGAEGYGVEFSIDSKRLYISTGSYASGSVENLYQFNLDLLDFTLINNSRFLVHSYTNTRGALQLASNGKIYWASDNSNFISVINNPENLGSSVNYSHRSVSLGSATSTQGLPPFIQSLFIANLNIIDSTSSNIITNLELCDGETYRLEPDISTYPPTTTYQWTLNGNIIPIMTSYLDIDQATAYSEGTYVLTVDFNNGDCPLRGEATVIFNPLPNIVSNIEVKQCDDNTDGFTFVDLTNINSSIYIDSQPVSITYHQTFNDADSGVNPIANDINFGTTTRYVYARVENIYSCYRVATVHILVTSTSANYQRLFGKCDDFLDINGDNNDNNDDTDGISTFDFSGVTNQVISLFPVTQQQDLTVAYYHNVQDGLLQQNEITNISNYRNITSPFYEKIYIRVNSTQNIDCIGFGENLFIELEVEPIPMAHQPQDKKVCATDLNGTYEFDTSNYNTEILQGQTNVTLTYIEEDGTTHSPALPNPFSTKTQTLQVVATNNITNDPDGQCSSETTLNMVVNLIPYVANDVAFEPKCDDGIDDTDGKAEFDTSLVEYHLLGGNNSQLQMQFRYFNEDGTQIFNENGNPSPLPNPFITESQTITVIMENENNTTCNLSYSIEFIVNPLPEFEIEDTQICLNYNEPVVAQIINQADVYEYSWFDNNGNEITVDPSNDYLEINQQGEYIVIAKMLDGTNCTRTKRFNITASETPNIRVINVKDNAENNQIAVIIEGVGEYQFALDYQNFEDANAPDGHIFYNVTEGLHLVRIIDLNGCGEITTEVPVISFPKFVTPNGDGINDVWQIRGNEAYSLINVSIFDRNGKVISQFTNTDSGWNGTYLGKKALPTDYWFVATFIDNKGRQIIRKGHFSLVY
jgi:gliding motility-associated-like protein